MFVPGGPFQPRQMLATGPEPTLVKLINSRIGSWPHPQTLLERLTMDEHSCLLRKFVNYGRKKFYNIGPRTLRSPFPPELAETLQVANLVQLDVPAQSRNV